MRRLATLPLLYQPGERWLYNTGSDVLGVLIARAAGRPLDEFLARAGLRTAGDGRHRLRHAARRSAQLVLTRDPETGEPAVYDAPDGQWAKPPGVPVRGRRLVSTIDDLHAFARMLLVRRAAARRLAVLSPASVAGDDHRPPRRRRGAPGPHPTVRRAGVSASPSRCAAPARPAPSAATDGPAASARRGPTTPPNASSASSSRPTRSPAPFPPPRDDPGLLDLRLRGDRRLSAPRCPRRRHARARRLPRRRR